MTTFSNLKNKYRNWVMLFFLGNAFTLFLLLIANPYRLTPVDITIYGLNDIKPRLYDYQRYVKIFDIAQQKPKTVILGSSRVLYGIDPQNPFLKQYPPVYNAGILGPHEYEILRYFQHAINSQPNLKRVILSLDFYEFNNKLDDKNLLLREMFDKSLQQIMNKHTELVFDLPATLQTIAYSVFRKHTMSLRRDGRLYPDPVNDRKLYSYLFKPLDEKEAHDQSLRARGIALGKAIVGMKDAVYLPFKLSTESLDSLRLIVETCKKRNIELLIYIPMTYQNEEFNAIMQYGLWEDYKRFEKILAQLHPFYDFVAWNDISLSRKSFSDCAHHTYDVGNMIIARMFNKPLKNTPANFGSYVTAESVDQHLQALKKAYNAYNDSLNQA